MAFDEGWLVSEERSLKTILAERLRAADPTSLRSYKLLDLLFKIVQWTVFSGLIRAIGIKTSNNTLSLLGAVLLLLVIFFAWQAIIKVMDGIYRPSGVATRFDVTLAYTIGAVAVAGLIFLVGAQLLDASVQVVAFYLKK